MTLLRPWAYGIYMWGSVATVAGAFLVGMGTLSMALSQTLIAPPPQETGESASLSTPPPVDSEDAWPSIKVVP